MQRHPIRLSAEQPFGSRRGIDTVLVMRFPFDPDVIALLKAAFQEVRQQTGRGNVGGWLPGERYWFCERFAWPTIRQRLLSAGHALDGDPSAGNGGPSAGNGGPSAGNGGPSAGGPGSHRPTPPVLSESLIAGWYRRLALKYHPDRGGSHEAMKIVNDAREQLEKLTGAKA
jgi:hypothetical protein